MISAKCRKRWHLPLFFIFSILINSTATLAAETPDALNPIHLEVLKGRWVRPDGGYVIDIRKVLADGRMEVGYFNPASIHISRAEWKKEGNSIFLFIELRDVNYPGATYDLRYYPENDQLAGAYYQPLAGQTFEIFFKREA